MFSLALLLTIVATAIRGLMQPWVAMMGWIWVSLMNLHVMSWRLADAPVAAVMAASVFGGILLGKAKFDWRFPKEAWVLVLFMLWMCITLPFSMAFDPSFKLWVRVMKIDVMILMALLILHSRQHIVVMTWVMAVSIAFYGVKGGLFTLATGGGHRVWGPEGTYIGGNNEVALALVMTIPLLRFLQLNSPHRWVRRGLVLSMLLCAAAALGSQSRGALLAIGAMTTLMWWRGKSHLKTGLVFLVLGAALILFMPDTWTQRMNTIQTYDQDDSANQRLNAWAMAFNIAKDRLFGAGYMVSMPDICAIYSPIPTDCRAAHSIYFMVLGEHGFIGLGLFIAMWALVWRSAGRLRKDAERHTESRWLAPLGAMAQVSIAGYAVGGAFLSLSYWDMPYYIMVLVVLANRWVDRKYWLHDRSEAILWRSKKAPAAVLPQRGSV